MCDKIPRPHKHTGEWVETYYDEWWCPTEERWVMCAMPCPDGSKHVMRSTPILAERIELDG